LKGPMSMDSPLPQAVRATRAVASAKPARAEPLYPRGQWTHRLYPPPLVPLGGTTLHEGGRQQSRVWLAGQVAGDRTLQSQLNAERGQDWPLDMFALARTLWQR
jgi:hypothetical protein